MEKNSEEVAFLVAQAGPLNSQRWSLHKDILIGRDSSCDIVIADRQVSRQHARLTIQADGIVIEDLNSKNGTHHNGDLIDQRTILQDGDVIQIALAQQFTFLSSDSTVPLESDLAEILAAQTADQAIQKATIRRLSIEKRARRVWIFKPVETGEIQREEIIPPLSVSQFRLLETLYNNHERVIPRRELVEAVWGVEQAYDVSEQALDALVRRLRDRIASQDPEHAYVITIRGHGLRLENPVISENLE